MSNILLNITNTDVLTVSLIIQKIRSRSVFFNLLLLAKTETKLCSSYRHLYTIDHDVFTSMKKCKVSQTEFSSRLPNSFIVVEMGLKCHCSVMDEPSPDDKQKRSPELGWDPGKLSVSIS